MQPVGLSKRSRDQHTIPSEPELDRHHRSSPVAADSRPQSGRDQFWFGTELFAESCRAKVLKRCVQTSCQKRGETPVAFAAAAVLLGGEAVGGFSLGSSSVGAVSGVSTLMRCSPASCSNVTTLAKSSTGCPSSDAFMNSSQMGSAARAPVSFFPSDICLSSKPTQTPAVSCGVNPMN